MVLFTAEVNRVSVTETPVSVMGLEDGVSSSYINKNKNNSDHFWYQELTSVKSKSSACYREYNKYKKFKREK